VRLDTEDVVPCFRSRHTSSYSSKSGSTKTRSG
jgi:hypothetical protein